MRWCVGALVRWCVGALVRWGASKPEAVDGGVGVSGRLCWLTGSVPSGRGEIGCAPGLMEAPFLERMELTKEVSRSAARACGADGVNHPGFMRSGVSVNRPVDWFAGRHSSYLRFALRAVGQNVSRAFPSRTT